jgi:hypothetical protein
MPPRIKDYIRCVERISVTEFHRISQIIPARMTARLEGDFVVFLIGMRVNRWWKFGKWVPVASAMQRMLMGAAGAWSVAFTVGAWLPESAHDPALAQL